MTWQEHGSIVASKLHLAYQSHGTNMATTCQCHCSNMATTCQRLAKWRGNVVAMERHGRGSDIARILAMTLGCNKLGETDLRHGPWQLVGAWARCTRRTIRSTTQQATLSCHVCRFRVAPCHVTATSLPRRGHVRATPQPQFGHAIAMPLPCHAHRCHAIAVSFPCPRRAFALPLQCLCNAIAMALPCQCRGAAKS